MLKKLLPQPGFFVICGAVLGALVGMLFGQVASVLLAQSEIRKIATGYILRADEVLDEAVGALDAINRSGFEPCSDDDLEHLRKIALNSRYLKGAGRRTNGSVVCTSDQGRLADPVTDGPADFTSAAGVRVFLRIEPAQMRSGTALLLAKDSASVLISHAAIGEPVYPGLRYGIVGGTDSGRSFQTAGKGVSIPANLALASGRPIAIGGVRHEVVCSERHPLCIVAAAPDGAGPRRPVILGGMAILGLLSGAAAGFGVGAARAGRQSLASQLRRALRAAEVSLAYQPIVRLADRRTVSLEVLARWRRPDGSRVPPDLFVSAAEQAGFATELTRYVTRKALAETAGYLRRNPDFTITINITAQDVLDRGFAAFMQEACRRHGVRSPQIGFELTERMTARIGALESGIARLRELGHYIYIDDFGVEYSSLSYLAGLHLDGVKLDRSFTTSIGADDKSEIIARQIVGMVSQLGMRMIVEGIETTDQADRFLSISADLYGQGWLFGKPVDFRKIEEA